MKRSVLFALLGLTSVEGMSITQKSTSAAVSTNQAATTSTSTTLPTQEEGLEFVQAIADLDVQQDDFDHKQEMEEADQDADELINEEDDDDDEELAAIEEELNAAPAKKPKNKDSSDEECACAPAKLTTKAKTKIQATQALRTANAKAARVAADAAKAAAEKAIAAANLAKRTSAANVLELARAAETAISTATIAENKSIEKQTEAKTKVSVQKSEKFDLKTKMVVKTWEETVVSKHEIWETYKSIKKNFRIAVTNVKLVRQNLKAAENKVVQLRKTAALNPKDVGAREKVIESERLVTVIRKQMLDAEQQKTKVYEEKQSAQTKAREASVASARAKASAEKAFRKMVIDNNHTCSACRLGKEKIAKRRLEIDGAIKQETKLKAQREAEKRRQSRGRGGRRSLTQQSTPSTTAPVEAEATQPVQSAVEVTRPEKKQKKQHHVKQEVQAKAEQTTQKHFDEEPANEEGEDSEE